MFKLNNMYMEEAGGGEGGEGSGGSGEGDAAAVAAALAGSEGDAGYSTGDSETNGWSFADNIKGEGEKPDWFKDSKYKTVSAQAQAYNELESKFGSFTGAPESYEVSLSTELSEKGMTIDAEDTMVVQAMEFAKASGMNQEGFNSLINLYGEVELSRTAADEEVRTQEMQALGSTAEKRIGNLQQWGKANMSADMYEGFESMAQTAQGVVALERLVAMTRSAPMDAGNLTPAGNGSAEELQALQFAKDEHGNRLINTDPTHKAKYEAMKSAVYGEGEHRVIVGS